MRPTRRMAVAAVLLGIAASVTATEIAETQLETTSTVLTEQAQARAWRLSVEEWQRYRSLMHGPRGQWSPALDPVTVLGIHAETEAERRRYAELLVMLEFERVGQELEFQRAYDAAARRLFPELRPVRVAATTAVGARDALRVAFVGSVDAQRCPRCRQMLARLLRPDGLGPTVGVDIYLADATDDRAIRDWARAVKIAPGAVATGRITLNHARGHWAATYGPLPRVVKRVGGRWWPVPVPR